MDPTTTLITFMLQTAPSIQSVQLLGSWDNFSQRYPMEKDLRRGNDQWRGCYTFKDIICDGDSAQGPKRSGGLKMGQDYWYYYELNDEVEAHNPMLPSTTSCPYLPGQEVNTLWVPVEVSPLRERSASTGSLAGGFKTMNPEDKFLTPRPPPAIPKQKLRLNTSPADLERKRTARSVSPRGKSPWSARALFGLRSPTSAQPESNRGRLYSPIENEFAKPPPQFPLTPVEARSFSKPSSAISRDASPHSVRKLQSQSRDPSPLRIPVVPENSLHSAILTIPDEITEEEFEDDDANFATTIDSITSLSPPPSRQLTSLHTAVSDMKPLPMLPVNTTPSLAPNSPDLTAASPSMVPSPLRPRDTSTVLGLPRSHFSIDTISTGFESPTDSEGYSSHFSYDSHGSPPSITDSYDDEERANSRAEMEHNANISADNSFQFQLSSNSSNQAEGGNGVWMGYSLPDPQDLGSELTLGRKEETDVGMRETFGPGAFSPTTEGPGSEDISSALDKLLQEMGYLGGVIVGK